MGNTNTRLQTPNTLKKPSDRVILSDAYSKGIVTTFLLINVTTENANKFYWPRITFNTLAEVQAGAVTTVATSGKIMLLISGAVIAILLEQYFLFITKLYHQVKIAAANDRFAIEYRLIVTQNDID